MFSNRWTSATVAVLLLATAIITGPRELSADSKMWGRDYFPNSELRTQDGKIVHFWDDCLKDKIVLINFIYTECSASCPLETAKLVQVYKLLADQMGKEIFFYSISLDPKTDTPAVLKAYANRYHANNKGWLFLTGKKADIEVIRKKIGLASHPGENDLTDHSTRIMIGNVATGQWFFDGPMDDPRYIATIAGDWLTSWKNHKMGESYTNATLAKDATDNGRYLFRTRCSACHSVGEGNGVGPDLLGVTNVRDHAWLMKFISSPDKVLESGDPIATALYRKFNKVKMPNLLLNEKDVTSIVKYLDRKSNEAAAADANVSKQRVDAQAAGKVGSR
jgi:protein SCO1